jgi:hypothetical protein
LGFRYCRYAWLGLETRWCGYKIGGTGDRRICDTGGRTVDTGGRRICDTRSRTVDTGGRRICDTSSRTVDTGGRRSKSRETQKHW